MDTQSIVDKCLELWRDPYDHLADLGLRGERMIAFFCTYTPEEIIYAAGFIPVRLMGAVRTITHADAHLQAYCCSLARTDLDMALAGELHYLEGAVFVQTCDTMQRLSDIWRRNTDFKFHGDLVLPIRMGEETSLPFLEEELRRFRGAIEEYLGEPMYDDTINQNIYIYNRNRKLIERLYRLRANNPGIIDGLAATACVVAGFWMRREEHNQMLQELLKGLEGTEPVEDGRTPLLVGGSVCSTPDLMELLLELDADVVDDDLCCGHRYIDAMVQEGGDPVEAIAERMWRRVNCPAKHQCREDHADFLMHRVEESGARGVVFFLQSFCEPHLFDIPYLKGLLQERDIPSLVLESELQSFSRGQLRTRLQAFMETIRGV
ncbi:MAG: 2-hydroxyacyl-CoA dehydratase family protein [Actinomycetota bacterium]|nr:2-hydroxyacyl-CoA dehydratase family protein [Actinomycetota bacterium]